MFIDGWATSITDRCERCVKFATFLFAKVAQKQTLGEARSEKQFKLIYLRNVFKNY